MSILTASSGFVSFPLILRLITCTLAIATGGAVYLSWNGVWQYLGFVSNDKPSAIFKVSSARPKVNACI
jgi:hypothetical protein